MNEIIYRIARRRFEIERIRARKAWLLTAGAEARAERQAAEAQR